ncbi:MAG: toprim domain-containing protein [Halobacteriota archaeon]
MRWQSSRERLRLIDRVLDAIRREAQDSVVLVEGRGDVDALAALGVEAEMIRVSGCGRRLIEMVEHVAETNDSAIVLTDWDEQGEHLKSELKRLLELHGVTPNTLHRRRLRGLTGKDIHDVESLATHHRNVRREVE